MFDFDIDERQEDERPGENAVLLPPVAPMARGRGARGRGVRGGGRRGGCARGRGRRGGGRGAPAGVQRLLGAGQKSGHAVSLLTRERIRAGMLKRQGTRLKTKSQGLLNTTCKPEEEYIGATLSKYGSQGNAGLRPMLTDTKPLSMPLTCVRKDRKLKGRRDIALCSQVASSSKRIYSCVDGDTVSLTSINVADDASMWIRKPERMEELCANPNGVAAVERLNKKMKIRGPNVHMPVLNSVEHVFIERTMPPSDDGQVGIGEISMGAECVVPAQVLPMANAGTICDRKKRWSIQTCAGPGKVKCGSDWDDVKKKWDATPWKTFISCSDNIGTNACVQALEEADVAKTNSALDDPEGDEAIGYLDVKCGGHSAILVQKPFVSQAGGTSTMLTRLAHILQSGRQKTRFSEGVDKIFTESFQYRKVIALPPEVIAWQAKTRRILELSRPNMDLTPAIEDHAVAALNGDPDSPEVFHYCLEYGCPLGCTSKEHSQKLVGQCILGLLTTALLVPLEYRWKYMERAMAWCFRGRRFHRILDRALKLMFTTKDIETAEAAAVRAALNGEDVAPDAKKKIKAGLVLKELDKDPDCMLLEKASILAKPAQEFLNATFAADKAALAYTKEVISTATDSKQDSAASETAMQKAFERNFSILSGERGRQVVDAYYNLLQDYKSDAWQDSIDVPLYV